MILTYEEWIKNHTITVNQELCDDMKRLLGIDAMAEAERALRHEYQLYLEQQNV